MTHNGSMKKLRFGFLTALEHPERGFVAGLLVTNPFGRPLEFQCTAPVKPNRTQQILYGPTLIPYVLGELAAQTLVDKAAVKPDLIFTDNVHILELRNHVSIPVVRLILPDSAMANERRQNTPENRKIEATVRIGQHTGQTHPQHESDREAATRLTAALRSDTDLSEPLERVQTALREAIGFQAGAA